MNKQEYGSNIGFWTKKGDSLMTIGDIIGRMSAIQLINPQEGELILDAGCGAGFITRRLAKAGAKVYGCDSNVDMIRQARKEETDNPVGIAISRYIVCDITASYFSDNYFDTISCISVLMHLSPDGCLSFFLAAYEMLRPNGKLVISITHPNLYYTHRSKSYWVNFQPLEKKHRSKSQRFKEMYQDKEGDEFVIDVWRHPKKFLLESLLKAGFVIEHTQDKYLTQDALDDCKQKGRVGKPCFFQIVARKTKM